MAGIDLVNFPNSKMGAAIAVGQSRFRVYGTDTTRFPNSKMGNAVALGVSRFLSLQVTGPPVIPANTGLPVISGTTVSGQTLTTTRGTWSGTFATYTYQWKRGVTNVGTNSNAYTLVTADVGSNITVVVTATNSAGSANATSAAVGPVTSGVPVNTVAPVISGTTQSGYTLTTTDGTWTSLLSLTYTYQWKRGVTNVGTGVNSYALVTADVGANITCVVTATNTAGNANATSNALGPITSGAPSNTVAPVISGTATIGNTLTSTTGTWTGAPTIVYTYQWYSGTTSVSGATSNSYVLLPVDVGELVAVVVTGTNSIGSGIGPSNSLGPVAATGTGPTSPVLAMDGAWTSADNTPDFVITVDNTIVAGDSLRLQIQISGGSWTSPVDDVLHVITAGEDSANLITLATGPQSNGSYQARTFVIDTVTGASLPSNVVPFTIVVAGGAATYYFLGF